MKTLRIPTLALSAGIVALAACTPVDAPTSDPHQRQKEGTAVGAATGALFGVLLGKNVKERRNAAIVGGIVGGVIGNAAGADLDKQARELQASIGDDRIQVINNGDFLTVRMPQDILFAFDSTAVQPQLQGELAAVAAHLNRYPNSTVVVVGHTDNIGSAAYNRDLSRRRAAAVAAILTANGVSPGRIQTVGMGEDQPIATNITPQGRAQNRRVEILIRPGG